MFTSLSYFIHLNYLKGTWTLDSQRRLAHTTQKWLFSMRGNRKKKEKKKKKKEVKEVEEGEREEEFVREWLNEDTET